MLNYNDLHTAQKDVINFILKTKVCCITPDCGGGKTVILLTAYEVLRLKKLTGGKPMLVVSTPEALKKTWTSEHLKWSHLKHLNLCPLIGTPKQRKNNLSAINKTTDLVLITYNNLKWLMDEGGIDTCLVAADEGSCLRSPSSKWRKYLIGATRGADYRVISTATPSPHDAMDYWGLCKYLDDGECFGVKTLSDFRSLYCTPIPIPNSSGVRWELKTDSAEKIEESVKHLFYTGEVNKDAQIPIEEIIVNCTLSDESQEKYDKVSKDQCINSLVEDETGRIIKEDSLSALTLSVKLGQISGGFVYFDENLRLSEDVLNEVTSSDELLKLSRQKKRGVIELFDDRIIFMDKVIKGIHKKHGEDKNIAITYLYKHDLVMLQRQFPEGVADTEPNFVERWNNGEIKYLFLQYGRSSKGLNLQAGGNIMVAYTSTYNWEDTYQIVRRIARQGQKAEKVYLYVLNIKNTIDDMKKKVLKQRGKNHKGFQKKVLSYIRSNMKQRGVT